MCLIFLFLIIIYNHFVKIKEGMECDLTGFRRKSPDQINSMTHGERELYKCQYKLYEKKEYSEDSINKSIENAKANLKKAKATKSNVLNTYLKRFNEKWKKFLTAKKNREVAVTKIEGYVCPTEDSTVKKYCAEGGEGDSPDEVEVDVEKEGGSKATRDPAKGPDPKLHNSQRILVDKQEKEAEGD